MSKIISWFKKFGGYLLVPVVFLAGFLTGRRSDGGARADFDKLRADHAELTARLQQREEELRKLADLHADDRERYQSLEEELKRARDSLAQIGDSIGSGQGNVDQLGANNKLLREWLQKYGQRIEMGQPEG